MADLLRPNVGHNASRRRTITRLVPGSGPRRKNSAADKQGSDVPDSSRHVHVKLENSYRMKPQQDSDRFQPWRVEKVMMEVLSARLDDFEYDSAVCQNLAKELAAEIQRRVKDFRWLRYRLVCQVTIGQQTKQGMEVASRCVWDHNIDSYASVTYNNKSVFAVAQCYGVYYE